MLAILIGDLAFLAVPLHDLFAAQATVDASVSNTATEHTFSGSQTVFTSDQVGYKFYVDSNGTCVYSKTSNGGTSWATAIAVDSQTDCTGITVWYDKWTPGDTGTYIHIATYDIGNDDMWYNRLDTTTDTRLLAATPRSTVLTAPGQGGTLTAGGNTGTVSKGTDGTLYMAMSDNTDSYVVECSASCNLAASWTETGTNPMDLQPDFPLILPLPGGNMLLIQRDVSADDLRSKVWNNGTASWDATWSTIDANAPENATYDPAFTAMINPDSGDIFLAYIDWSTTGVIGGNNDSVKTAKYSGGSWSNTADVLTNSTMGLTGVAMGIDANTGDIYVAYTGRTTPATVTTVNVYWASSTDTMSSWGTQQGPVNTATDNLYSPDLNSYNDERILVTWYRVTAATGSDDLFSNTIADITPITVVSAAGTQTTEVRAGKTNFYVGGKFAIKENVTSRNVTDITINETGTVDASTGLNNIKLFYDLDTSAPYDCASESYAGSETQFGSTDTNGFSGADGASSFAGSVNITPTQAMCVYVVLDVLSAAGDGVNMDIQITNPVTDVLVSGGVTAVPATAQAITGSTNIVDSVLTQTHFHWRYDDNTETLATSRTGGVEDTALTAIQQNVTRRLRFGVSNEGSSSTLATTLRLEYAPAVSTCDVATGWTDVGATSDDWDMSNSTFITDGANSTNISNAIGGVTNENSVFLTPNGGLRDTSSQLGSLTFLPTNWTEMEFSIMPTILATEGNTYCFRLTDAGTPLPAYTNYAKATVAADVTVRATSTQTTATDIPTTGFYVGGAFAIIENAGSRNVTDITITENGTADGMTGVDNIKLFYDLDTSTPYDCASESYAGGESQFGSTDTDGFSSANGTSTFSGSVAITTTQAMCVYPVMDVTESARNGETLDITINSGSGDVLVSGGGSVAPNTALDITGSTTLEGGVVTQTHYHWRNDDGDETAAGATSATGGTEDTIVTDFTKETPIRLRIGLENTGPTSSVPHRYGLEYGIKSTTCSDISVWTDADGGGVSWSMFDSTFLTNGNNTTNIAVSAGGVSDVGGKTFLSANGGVRDTESFAGTSTLTNSQFTDLEFSITSTADTPYETNFCFRVTQNGLPLLQYNQYPELSIQPKRDFKIQRGESVVSGSGVTLTAGVDYVAPAASTSAFVRITNSHHTGAGKNTLGGNQNSNSFTAYISNPGNIETSFTIARPTGAINNTYVNWEIIEYIGPAGGDNEMIVRDQSIVGYGTADVVATSSAVSGVVDDADVVVFITGQTATVANRTEAFSHQSTASWSASTDEAVFVRGNSGGNAGNISYVVVEFTGLNWKIQRVEHSYSAVNTPETESITAVNSLSKTFLHTQKRFGVTSVLANVGHDVWLSSIGAVTFQLDSGASTAFNHVSVAWVIENIQAGTGAMTVQRSNGNTTGGVEPVIISVPISTPLNGTNNASIFMVSTVNQTGDNLPRPFAGAYITSSSSYQVWRSDGTGTGDLTYRTEIVQWPAADLAVRQNYYRFYADNDAILPTDPWPIGATDLGENTSISTLDEPLADFDHIRIRMTASVKNATLPAGLLNVKLQYGLQETTCSAITAWTDVGAAGSGAIWRGYNAAGVTDGDSLSGNPATSGDLLLSVADRAGRYTESNPASANAYAVFKNEDIEYDWHIEQNGAPQRSNYCFRMIKVDETELDGYSNYPIIRTEGFTPVTEGWQWFDDETSETPTVALSAESIAPNDLDKNSLVKLRVTVNELKNLSQINARFKLQFSEQADFSTVSDVVASTTCSDSSIWCYIDAAGTDNGVIDAKVLSTSDACTGGVGNGCGVHVESDFYYNGFTHGASRNVEYEFALKYTNVYLNFGKVYYFRLYDVANSEAVLVNTGYSTPSLAGESARLTQTSSGVNSGTTIGDITTDVNSTQYSINFSSLPIGSSIEAAQQMTITTNATAGYQLLMYAPQQMLNSYGDPIPAITSTNASPTGWNTACTGSVTGCFGYHTTDATLEGGSARFSPVDSYAALDTTPQEIMYSSIPTEDAEYIVYRVRVNADQSAGDYTTSIVYLSVPIY